MLETLALGHFERLVGEQFALRVDDSEVLPAVLVAARAGRGRRADGQPSFSLLFEGPPAPVLPQRIYEVAAPDSPMLEIFLVPVGRSPEGVHYEAIFS